MDRKRMVASILINCQTDRVWSSVYENSLSNKYTITSYSILFAIITYLLHLFVLVIGHLTTTQKGINTFPKGICVKVWIHLLVQDTIT